MSSGDWLFDTKLIKVCTLHGDVEYGPLALLYWGTTSPTKAKTGKPLSYFQDEVYNTFQNCMEHDCVYDDFKTT